MRNKDATLRSLRKQHLAALLGVFACVLAVTAAGYLLLVELAGTEAARTAALNAPGSSHLPLTDAGFVYLSIVLTSLGGIVLISMSLYQASVGALRHDIYNMVRMFKDVRQGEVRAPHPMMLTEFAAAQRYLRSWGEAMLAEKEKLTDMGLIDHLSQLSNRRHFELRLKELFDHNRTHGPSSVLIIDADHFKQVNDRHGHDAGDALIAKFAALLRSHVRQTDFLARFGGDEFCVIYTYVPFAKAAELVERLRRELPRAIELKAGVHHELSWSGGLSAMCDLDTRPDDALRRADQALLHAKEAGRNRTMAHDPKNGQAVAALPRN